mmetsp:Transcript_16673/g.20016  ORF Transcript_16673/g.20016 Transcript_16673/m.20016 type:complete len:676 (-) Transcript_16673:596-2623(-)
MDLEIENDEGVEQAGASDAVKYMEQHWDMLVNTESPKTNLHLTEKDSRLYSIFRGNFALFDVKTIGEASISGERWRKVLLGLEMSIADYNMMTILRKHAHLSYESSNQELIIVPRAAFILIEIARNLEGLHENLVQNEEENLVIQCLQWLLQAINDQQPVIAAKHLRMLSSVSGGKLSKKCLKQTGAGRILTYLMQKTKATDPFLAEAIASLRAQWQQGIKIKSNSELRFARCCRETTLLLCKLESASAVLGFQGLNPELSKMPYVGKIELKFGSFPILATKTKLLLASNSCHGDDLSVKSMGSNSEPSLNRSLIIKVRNEMESILRVVRILILTYEEIEAIPLASLLAGLCFDKQVEERATKFLKLHQNVPWVNDYLEETGLSLLDCEEGSSGSTEVFKFFQGGCNLIGLNDDSNSMAFPGNIHQPVETLAELERLENTITKGIKKLNTHKLDSHSGKLDSHSGKQISRNELYKLFHSQAVENINAGPTSLLDTAQAEAYLADSESAYDASQRIDELTLMRLRTSFTSEMAQQLEKFGYVVLENMIDTQLLKNARRDMEAYHEEGHLKQNPQALQGARRRDDVIAHVSSKAVDERGFTSLAKVIALLRSVPFVVQSACNSEWVQDLEVPHEIMFASYDGSGALHQSHRDNLPEKGHARDNGRVVTAIMYMNEDW